MGLGPSQPRPVANGGSYYERDDGERKIGILSFEVSNLASRLSGLWQVVQDGHLRRLDRDVMDSEGVSKLICRDRELKLQLLEREILEDLRRASVAVARLGRRCTDAETLKATERLAELQASGKAPEHHGVFTSAAMDAEMYALEAYISATGQLYGELEMRDAYMLSLKGMQDEEDSDMGSLTLPIERMKKKVAEQIQSVKVLEESSFWNLRLDGVVRLFTDMILTIHDRALSVLGPLTPVSTPSLSPSSHSSSPKLASTLGSSASPNGRPTLGDVGLSVHYANLIIMLEGFSDQPGRVTDLSRSRAYGMLPESMRVALRKRLAEDARDGKRSVNEWDRHSEDILKWLGPMAHATVRRQAERNFEAQLGSRPQTLVMETLFLADRERAEAAILDLLVGLTHVVRREKEIENEEMERAMAGFRGSSSAPSSTSPLSTSPSSANSGPISGG